jgi:hypothetical protein
MMNASTLRRVVTLSFLLAALAGLAGPASAEEAEAFWASAPGETAVKEIRLAAGQQKVVRLKAAIADACLLKAYSLKIGYDPKILAIEEVRGVQGGPIPVMSVNDNGAGVILANGFDVHGVSGPMEISILDVTVKGGEVGSSVLRVSFDNFGQSKQNQFIPLPISLDVIVN